jgi:hypothetical protein
MRSTPESSVLDVATLHLVDELDAFPSWASVHEEQVIEGVVHDVERADGSVVAGSAVLVTQSGTKYVLLNPTDPHMPRQKIVKLRARELKHLPDQRDAGKRHLVLVGAQSWD